MKHELQVTILKELLRQLETGRTADARVQVQNPASSYTSSELAGREWNRFFRDHPQLIGLSGDLPEPGSYMTIDDFGVPVLATRDDDGRFRAFVNACRHRGVRVAQEPRGEERVFVCPFHHWTYTNAGELVSVPRNRDFGAFDASCRGLIELPADERYGQLWLHPKPEGVLDVAALLGDLAPELESWNLGALHFAGQSTIERNLNWKLANDTFGETYHVNRLHQNTIAEVIHGDTLSYQAFGRNHRFAFALKGIEALREQPEETWSVEGTANVLYFLFPNVQLNVAPNSVQLIRIYPSGAGTGRSLTRVSHYLPRAAIEADGPDAPNEPEASPLAFVMDVFDRTIEHEDYATGETAQQAVESGLLDYLIFGRNEPGLHHFHNAYRAALGMSPLERFDG